MDRPIKSDAELHAKFKILVSIPGISAVTATAILVEFPELGQTADGKAAALAGLAPMARESGYRRGRSMIRGDRRNLRRALYMPALVASRHNPDLKRFYSSLVAAGKPAKVAIVAVMRKLLLLANAFVRQGRNWEARPVPN